MNHDHIHVFINHERFAFSERKLTGDALRVRAEIPDGHLLAVECDREADPDRCACDPLDPGSKLGVIGDNQSVHLEDGQCYWSLEPPLFKVTVTINRKLVTFGDACQTGASIKAAAGIAPDDVLFLDQPCEDDVVTNDSKVILECDMTFHSAPPADYGSTDLSADEIGFEGYEMVPQADGWRFLLVDDYSLPAAFTPDCVRLLVKLPPLFPEAAPDMFWVSPHVTVGAAGPPQGTSTEQLLGASWQRFSWHLVPGAWQPGISTLRDFLHCVRARLERCN